MKHHDQDKENYVAYVLGRIEAKVEGYAESGHIPFSELSDIVGKFLCSKAGGQLLRGVHSMPALSQHGGRVGRPGKEGRASVAEVALLGNAYSHVSKPLSKKSRLKISKALKAAWRKRHAEGRAKLSKPHWTQTPEGRKKMAERARKFWRDGTWKGRQK